MQLDKRTIRKILLIIAFGVGLAWLLQNLQGALNILGTVWRLLWPFILGLILAFLINIPMRFLEKLMFRGRKGHGRRMVSFLVTLVLVLGVLALVSWLVVPQLISTIALLFRSMPEYLQNLQDMLAPYEKYVPMLQNFLKTLDLDWSSIANEVMGVVQSSAGTVFSSAWGFATSLVSGTVNFFIGFVFACYVLLEKERLHFQVTGVLKAHMKMERYEKMMETLRLVDRIFAKFVSGSCLEALALTTIFTLLLTIFGFPYSLLIGVLIGIFSFIPIFGSTIACIIGALLILMADGFWPAIIFVIMFLVIQQLDGNFMYPHIVGNSVGLPAIWVLVAVTLGASLMGIAGMLLFIPASSVLYALLRRDTLCRLEAKGIEVPQPAPKKEGRLALWMRKQKEKWAQKRAAGEPAVAVKTKEDTAASAKETKSPPKKKK